MNNFKFDLEKIRDIQQMNNNFRKEYYSKYNFYHDNNIVDNRPYKDLTYAKHFEPIYINVLDEPFELAGAL